MILCDKLFELGKYISEEHYNINAKNFGVPTFS